MSTAIITGASMGFGKAVAMELARQDWNLVVDGRSRDSLEAAERSLSLGEGEVRAILGDVVDEAHRIELLAAAVDLGDFRLLINNASTLGPSPLPPLAVYPIADLRRVIDVNLLAPLSLIQIALPHLRGLSGTVVNITSDAAVEPYEGWGGYGMSKAALEQASNVLASEETDVTVYWFDPGDMKTRMHQEAFPGEDISDRPDPESRVPALVDLLGSDLQSGRYTAEFLLARRTSV